MNKIILLITLFLTPLVSNAALFVQTFDLSNMEEGPVGGLYPPFGGLYPLGGINPTPIPSTRYFQNNWFITWGETAGYVSFEAYASFDAVMYLIAYDDEGVRGSGFGDVIATSTPTGSFGQYGYNQKIEGFLGAITDKDGTYWSGYAVFTAPVGFTEEMLRAEDYSYIDEYFSVESVSSRAIENGFQDQPRYTLVGSYPIEIVTGYHVERPEGVVTLNEQYLASASVSSPSANVSEPATATLLGLALFSAFYTRRKKEVKV